MLGENDVVNLGLNDMVLQDTVIQVTRQYNVYVVANGIAKGYVIPEGAVSQSMATTDFVLQGEDYFANGDAPVSENLIIGVNHVTYQEVQTTEEIPYSVVNKDTDTLYKGSTQVENQGINGSKNVTSRQKLVNGEVVSSRSCEGGSFGGASGPSGSPGHQGKTIQRGNRYFRYPTGNFGG